MGNEVPYKWKFLISWAAISGVYCTQPVTNPECAYKAVFELIFKFQLISIDMLIYHYIVNIFIPIYKYHPYAYNGVSMTAKKQVHTYA